MNHCLFTFGTPNTKQS